MYMDIDKFMLICLHRNSKHVNIRGDTQVQVIISYINIPVNISWLCAVLINIIWISSSSREVSKYLQDQSSQENSVQRKKICLWRLLAVCEHHVITCKGSTVNQHTLQFPVLIGCAGIHLQSYALAHLQYNAVIVLLRQHDSSIPEYMHANIVHHRDFTK